MQAVESIWENRPKMKTDRTHDISKWLDDNLSIGEVSGENWMDDAFVPASYHDTSLGEVLDDDLMTICFWEKYQATTNDGWDDDSLISDGESLTL